MYAAGVELIPTSMSDRQGDIFAAIGVAAVIDREAGQPLATPALTAFIEESAASINADGPADYVFALHALWLHFESRWQNGKALLKTAERLLTASCVSQLH